MPVPATPPASGAPARVGRYRWAILRPALLRDDHQLRRLAGRLAARADAQPDLRLDRSRLQLHRLQLLAGPGLLVSGGIHSTGWGRKMGYAVALIFWSFAASGTRSPTSTPALAPVGAAGRAHRLRVRDAGRERGRVQPGALRARPRRGRQLPGGDQGRWPSGSRSNARSPPASSTRARTSAPWWCRSRCRGLRSRGVHHHRRPRLPLARLLVHDVPDAPPAPVAFARTRLHRERPD